MTIRESLEAEIYRLRAALERIASIPPSHAYGETASYMARHALNKKQRAEVEPGIEAPQEPAIDAPRAEWKPEPVAPEQESLSLEIPDDNQAAISAVNDAIAEINPLP